MSHDCHVLLLLKDLNERLKRLTTSAPCMLFMKGTPQEPRCGMYEITHHVCMKLHIKHLWLGWWTLLDVFVFILVFCLPLFSPSLLLSLRVQPAGGGSSE